MSEKKTGTSEKAMADAFQPLSDGAPEEYLPSESGGDPNRYAKAERALTVLTGILSVLLIIGSIVFWWYFGSKLSACALVINNYQLYTAMLIGCAAIPLAVTAVQALLRVRVSLESWMVDMCASGFICAVIMLIYNSAALGSGFAANDLLTILCFSVSGCALPAAVYTLIRWGIESIAAWAGRSAMLDREMVYSDVRAQCEGRF